jgi:DNA-binding CsgD family transcriptional regulator/PAS domain-containing protein
MTQADPIHRMLGTLYAAPMRPELWGTFLGELSTISGVTKAALISHDVPRSNHRMLATLGDSVVESVTAYERGYFQFDEWTMRFPRQGLRKRVVLGEELWPEESLVKSTFYNDFLKPFDTCQMACIAAVGAPGDFDALSVYRGPNEVAFSRELLTLLQMLQPHLQTALALRRRLFELDSHISDLETALDLMASGLVLLDAKGECILVNKTAKKILDQRSGLFYERSALYIRDVAEMATLREAISSAISPDHACHRRHQAFLISRGNKKALHILIAPIPSETVSASGNAAAVVLISDPEDKTAVPAEIFSLLFGLTPAEARLASALLAGKSLSEAAELYSVCQETVRTQIKSVFQKTGTRRQGELIRLLSPLSTFGAQSACCNAIAAVSNNH